MAHALAALEREPAGLGPRYEAMAYATPVAEAVHAILSVPDAELDYARAKLALDNIVDAESDISWTLAELDRLTEAARRLAGSDGEGGKLAALRKLIYESGPWNDERPFAYDHSDPLGRSIPNKLLHNYLVNRLGQCVSMPALFLILADRLGLDVALARAPEHVFVRYTDPSGRAINLETTSGAQPARTEWFRQNFPMSDRALERGLYMRTLTPREGVALLASTVVEHLQAEGRHDEVIAVCGIILTHDSRDAVTMAIQGSAYGALLQREFEQRYPVPFLIPEPLRMRRLMLMARNHSLNAAAQTLGWQPFQD
jgi:regulator of sirC expression with transglutaminase-like and TPR domain